MTLLRIDSATIRFGGLVAVSGVSLELEGGEILALIGPNGAGKSTIFNLITGIYPPGEGGITFKGRSIAGLPPHVIAASGIGRTFQNTRLFKELTVLDNCLIGTHSRGGWDLTGALLKFLPAVRREEGRLLELASHALSKVELAHKACELAGNLSYGEQRRLEIARALAAEPDLILLDEPAAGMNPQEKQTLAEMVRNIRDGGVTVFLVEHDMRFVMGLSDRIAVLDHGVMIAEGRPDEVRTNQAVIEAYLGKGAQANAHG